MHGGSHNQVVLSSRHDTYCLFGLFKSGTAKHVAAVDGHVVQLLLGRQSIYAVMMVMICFMGHERFVHWILQVSSARMATLYCQVSEWHVFSLNNLVPCCRCRQIQDLCPDWLPSKWLKVFSQNWEGDVTMVLPSSYLQLKKAITNPSKQDLLQACRQVRFQSGDHG